MENWLPSTLSAISVLLALAVVGLPLTALIGRIARGQGIGWQFIRYSVIITAVPLVGLLALNKSLTAEVATILA